MWRCSIFIHSIWGFVRKHLHRLTEDGGEITKTRIKPQRIAIHNLASLLGSIGKKAIAIELNIYKFPANMIG
jgi:hypothetical protein